MDKPRFAHKLQFSDTSILILIGAAVVLLHTLVNNRYGFHRDELLTFDNARHLAWGYVVYPPFTAAVGRVELVLFGASLAGFRFFVAAAQGIALVLTGLMAREMGARREAQIFAAIAAGTAGHALFSGSFMSYSSFDYLWWVLVAYLAVRLLKSDDARWWPAIGAAIGLGLLTKYTMVFLVFGVLGGLLLTPTRKHLKSPWFWCGVAVAALFALPNALWQVKNHFVTLEFLRTIHARDIRWGWTDYFLLNQLWRCTNPVTTPLWFAGLWCLFRDPRGERYRLLGWMYALPLAALFAARGRDYYLAAAYPMLIAAGSVWAEGWVNRQSPRGATITRHVAWHNLAWSGASIIAVTLPIAPLGSAWWRIVDQANGNFNMEIGWPEMVATVASIRDSLPPADRAGLGIFAGDDGESGAIDLYGPRYGLPAAICASNSNWDRGYGDPPPETVITASVNPDLLRREFESCAVAGRMSNPYGIANSAVGFTGIYVCRHPRQPWPELWRNLREFH